MTIEIRPDRLADEIEVTPEMIEAGVRVAWTGSRPPQIVMDQVRKIYIAMEAEKARQR